MGSVSREWLGRRDRFVTETGPLPLSSSPTTITVGTCMRVTGDERVGKG